MGDVMQSSADPLPSDMDVSSARRRLEQSGQGTWLVGQPTRLYGVVTLRQLQEVANPASTLLNQIVHPESVFPFVHSDHPLSLALERMGAAGAEALPVVSRANRRRVEGIITLPDILTAYGVLHQEAPKS